ncbi:PorZ beta-propeller-like domain-containing protein [Lunatibacter salilacus]|uniref:PorZ beta-propeller-like domain-containing protein n=1 Tax=Lunatibacter salilacus TaxID=2483804 RepID=UPI00131B00A2|nr:two-component regulator propeller domain-containing protein [Lunatibacter salilacus]
MKQGAENAFLMVSPKLLFGCLLSLSTVNFSMAQGDIAVGSWRFHLSHQYIKQLTGSDETVFALGENSLFYFSTSEPTPKTLSKLDGLYGHNFESITFDLANKTLLITYTDGTMNLVTESAIRRINDIRTNALITEKTIRKVRIINGAGWLAADFGLARVNLTEGFIESAYLNLGPSGSQVPILDVAILSNEIYALTESGVIRASLSANLRDLNQWERLDLGTTTPFIQLIALEEELFFLGQNQQVYQWNSGSFDWVVGTFGVENLKLSGERVNFSMENAIYSLDANGNLEIISSNVGNEFNDFLVTQEDIFLATSDRGIYKLGDAEGVYPPGPPSSLVNFAQLNGQTAAFASGLLNSGDKKTQRQLGVFSSGNWENWEAPDKIQTVANINGINYIGTQNGLFRQDDDELSHVSHPLLGNGVEIGAISGGPAGKVYIGTNTPTPRLFVGDNQDQFIGYEVAGLQRFDKILVDRFGNCWILETQQGGGRLRVYNPENGLNRTFGTQINNGALPGQWVRDIYLDSEQNLWIATNQGIAYFFNAPGIDASAAVNAVLPIFENRLALANTAATQILLAPDRSIWIGTENQGLWHFGPDFEGLIRNFTVQNSPLPSPEIRSLALNEKSGELFISTSEGSLSFRAESIRPADNLGVLKIYPNPIRNDFNGVLSIEGTTDFSTLKIATTAGRVVASMAVGAGKVTWNLRDPSGNRIGPGVYLVYVVDEAGRERTAGNFLVH